MVFPKSLFVMISLGVLSLSAIGCTQTKNLQGDLSQSTRLAESPAAPAQSPTAPTQDTPPTFAPEAGPNLDVPYVPTPQAVVDEMLRLGKVGPNDRLYDLGSGDGRIVVTAAQRYGTRGIGVDIDPERIQDANANAQRAGVTELVEFRQQDLFNTDLSNATVVTLYLLPDINLKLRPKLFQELKPGTRIVSHAFDMGDWKPDQVVQVDNRTIYLWTVPDTVPSNLR